MSGPSGGAGGSYAPDYPHDYPPASSSYSPGPVKPMGFVDGEEQQAQRMPTPPPGYPDPSTPAGGYGQGVAEQATVSMNYPSSHSGGSTLRRTPSTASLPPTPEVYYTPAQSGGRTLGRSNSATSLSPASEVYYTPAQTGRLTPGRKPLAPSLLPAPEVYYTPVQTGCPMLGRTQSETSLSPTPEVYYTPSQAGGPTLGRTPSAAPLSPVPGGSSHAGSIPVLPLSASPAGYPSGAYLPYTPPPPMSAQYLYGSGNGYSTSGRCRSARADPVTGTPYPSTTPSGAPGRDAVCYGTPAGYYGGSAPGTSCYPPGRGTIKTHMNFNVERDVEALKKAMGGWTTDHAAIIDIVCARSEHQRQEIVRVYKQSFGRDIVDDARSALRGNLEDVVVGLLYPVHEYLARELHRAIAGLGTDEECLIEILCTHSNEDIRLIKDHYQRIFKKDLEKDIIGDTSGDFRRLLVSMCNAQREENTPLDPVRARNDAAQLQKAGVLRWGTDVSAFNRIIATQSYEQLRLVFREYNALANHTVMEAIKSEMSGDLRKGFLVIVKCVYSPPFYFAETLYYAMKGLGTNDRVLKRVVLSRCEKDLELIKQEYEDKYKVTLASAIQSDTSGNYRKALLALVHGN